MHALRIGYQGIELLETGRITLPMPEPERSRAARGARGQGRARRRARAPGAGHARLEVASKRRDLPAEPDIDAVDAFVVRAYRASLGVAAPHTPRGYCTFLPMKPFIRHYLEMVAAMFIGMGVLGMPAGMLVVRRGRRAARDGREHDHPDGRLDALPRPLVADRGGDERRDARADRRGHRAARKRRVRHPDGLRARRHAGRDADRHARPPVGVHAPARDAGRDSAAPTSSGSGSRSTRASRSSRWGRWRSRSTACWPRSSRPTSSAACWRPTAACSSSARCCGASPSTVSRRIARTSLGALVCLTGVGIIMYAR